MTTSSKTPKIMIHPLNENENNENTPGETTRLIPSSHRKSRNLSYSTIFFLMFNRSINLVFYKTLPTFSWYFAQDFKMNYTLFAVTVLNLGALINIIMLPFYSKFNVRYVTAIFELILSASFLMIIPWHTVIGLLISRLLSTFVITATRSEVNAIIAAFTHGSRRTRAIGIIEISFGLSPLGFLIIGIILEQFGYKILFIASAILVAIITICILILVPGWNTHYHRKTHTKKNKKRNSSELIKRALAHKRLQLIFISVLLNKIARNAFYYTFSKWLAMDYGLGAQQTGYMTLCIAAGCLVGTIIIPIIIKKIEMTIHVTCLLSAMIQVFAMIIEPIYHIFGKEVSILGVCGIIFSYFCGCQIWYNNILDIMIGVTPTPKLLPAVNTILLVSGLIGGIIGTIGSTVWYEWGGHVAISTICAAANIGGTCIVILLWISDKHHRNSQQSQKIDLNTENKMEERKNKKDNENIYSADDLNVPKVLSDSSYALRIVGGKSTLENINEQETLLQ